MGFWANNWVAPGVFSVNSTETGFLYFRSSCVSGLSGRIF